MNTLNSRWLMVLASLAATVGTACTSPSVPAQAGKGSAQTPQAAAAPTPAPADSAPDGQPDASLGQREEIWMACSVNGGLIGYTHLVMEPTSEDDRPCFRFSTTTN